MKRIQLLAITTAVSAAVGALAQVPSSINSQGRLSADGTNAFNSAGHSESALVEGGTDLNLRGYGQQTNATTAEEKPLSVTNKAAPRLELAEIRTLEGVSYKSVRVLKAEPDGLLVEHSPQGGGIGVARLKFENLSNDLRQRYGYDAQRAAAYRAERAEMEAELGKRLWEQHWRDLAAARAKLESDYRARQEFEILEAVKRRAEADLAQAKAAEANARAAEAQANAKASWSIWSAGQIDQEIVEQGYQIRDMWERSRRR